MARELTNQEFTQMADSLDRIDHAVQFVLSTIEQNHVAIQNSVNPVLLSDDYSHEIVECLKYRNLRIPQNPDAQSLLLHVCRYELENHYLASCQDYNHKSKEQYRASLRDAKLALSRRWFFTSAKRKQRVLSSIASLRAFLSSSVIEEILKSETIVSQIENTKIDVLEDYIQRNMCYHFFIIYIGKW